MYLELDATARVALPVSASPDRQSLWVFNMYRAASSLTEALGKELSVRTARTAVSVQGILWRMGVTLVDPHDYSRSSAFLARDGVDLLRLCDFGGYVYMGFREVPRGFAERFTHVGAAALVVRDLRDIGVSHYFAISKHEAPDTVAGDQVLSLRSSVLGIPLQEYLLKPETIGFLNRIADCYRPIIEKGIKLIRYEDSARANGEFALTSFVENFLAAYRHYCSSDFDRSAFLKGVEERVANSSDLKGHGTFGTIGQHLVLPDVVRERLSDQLGASLELLGYK